MVLTLPYRFLLMAMLGDHQQYWLPLLSLSKSSFRTSYVPFIIRFNIHLVLHYAPSDMTTANIMPFQHFAFHAFRCTHIILPNIAE